MEAVTSLISAGADVNDVNQVRHGVCSVSPHTLSDGLVCDVISVSLHMSVITQYHLTHGVMWCHQCLTTHVCRHTEWRLSTDGGCQEG